MAALSGEQVAQLLYQAGFRGDDLTKMLAIAKRESGWQPDAHRTDRPKELLSGDMGLFQINYTNWNLVSSALGLTSKSQLFDPLTNALAAKVLYDRSGLSPWSMGPGGWTAGGDPMYGTNYNEAQRIVQQATASGAITQTYGAGPGGSTQTSYPVRSVDGSSQGTVTLPPDAKIYHVPYFGVMAVFDVGGVKLSYDIPWWSGQVPYNKADEIIISDKDFNAMGAVNAGSALELAGLNTAWGTYQQFWDSIMNTVIGPNNPARNDPGVLRVIAQFAARPDMTEAELENLLQATDYYQARTQDELKWNDMSEAERDKQREETSARMVQTVFQFAGESVDPTDPRIANYLEMVASGKMGFGAFTEHIKRSALENEESPWSRQVRDEQEAQKKRPIDIENTGERIRETLTRWGLQWSDESIHTWAKGIVSKDSSDEDLMNEIRTQAKTLFPWKDEMTETSVAAAPWLETYRRVMETGADLTNTKIQSALQAGKPAWEFEQELKRSTEWLGTQNGQSTMESIVANVGRRMGFE